MQNQSSLELGQSKSIQNETKKVAVKKSSQGVFKFTCLFASILSSVLLPKIYQFQTMPQFDEMRKGTVYDIIAISLPFGILFTIFDIFIHKWLDGPCQKYYLNQQKYIGEARKKRSYTLVKWGYSSIYYLLTTIIGVHLIKDTNFFPKWLGGNGSCLNLFSSLPNMPEANIYMKIFYLLQFGKHFSRLFSHAFIKPQGNYYQYVLHHLLSTFLIIFSYLSNQWFIGIMVLICHDGSDFFLTIGRGYKQFKYCSKRVLQFLFGIGFMAWVVGRLIIFPYCCVYSGFVEGIPRIQFLNQIQRQTLSLPLQWMVYMLVILFGMQIFWTYYIVKAFLQVNVSKKLAVHSYD